MSGLNKEGEERQVSTLFYCLGDTVDNVLTSTNNSVDRKNYNSVLAKLDDFFKFGRMLSLGGQISIAATNYPANWLRSISLRLRRVQRVDAPRSDSGQYVRRNDCRWTLS